MDEDCEACVHSCFLTQTSIHGSINRSMDQSIDDWINHPNQSSQSFTNQPINYSIKTKIHTQNIPQQYNIFGYSKYQIASSKQ